MNMNRPDMTEDVKYKDYLCNTTKDFRVLRIGTSIRVNKQSFDNWFAEV